MTTTQDILGNRNPCYFSTHGNNPFKYEPCRSKCDGYNTICPSYIPSHNSRQSLPKIPADTYSHQYTKHDTGSQSNRGGSSNKRDKNTDDKSYLRHAVRPFFWYHSQLYEMPVKVRNFRNTIRRYNDSGCI